MGFYINIICSFFTPQTLPDQITQIIKEKKKLIEFSSTGFLNFYQSILHSIKGDE